MYRGRNTTGSPKFLMLLFTHTTLLVDPGRPSENSPYRSLCVGFGYRYILATCFIAVNGAVSSLRECGLPCGLSDSLCTLQLFRSKVAELPDSLPLDKPPNTLLRVSCGEFLVPGFGVLSPRELQHSLGVVG